MLRIERQVTKADRAADELGSCEEGGFQLSGGLTACTVAADVARLTRRGKVASPHVAPEGLRDAAKGKLASPTRQLRSDNVLRARIEVI